MLLLSQNQMPVTNPGFLVTIPQVLQSVNMNTGSGQSTLYLSTSTYRNLWIIDFNFNTHTQVYQDGYYATSLSYTDISPGNNTLVVGSSSLYNNHVGITLFGGTYGVVYTVTVGVVLNNSQVLTHSIRVQINQ